MPGRYIRIGLLGWLVVIGFDLFLHAGVLASLYRDPGPFLLASDKAFKLIPLGYLSFAILIAFVEWLMVRMKISGAMAGFRFGIISGMFIWLSLGLGLASISSAPLSLLAGWTLGQAVELGLAGAVMGAGLGAESLRGISFRTVIVFVISVVLAIVLQNIF